MKTPIMNVCARLRNFLQCVGISSVYGLLIGALAFPHTVGFSSARAGDGSAQGVPGGPGGHKEPEVDIEDMREYYSALQEIRDDLSREDFDPATVVERVGTAPADLSNWVTEHIAWVPYSGHLRSPSAVMMDGTGNSLDRAVLLATLLRLAGHQPRIAMAPVDGDWWARHALPRLEGKREIRPPVEPQTMNAPEDVEDPAHRALINEYIDGRKSVLVNTLRRAETQLPHFVAKLSEQEPESVEEDSQFPARHWWVEVDNGGDAPLRLDSAGAPPMEAEKVLVGMEIPLEHQHAVEVRIRVEQWKDGTRTEKEALNHTFLAPELSNNHFQIGFVPEGVTIDMGGFQENPEEALRAYQDQLAATKSWVPYIQAEDEIVTELGFTATGEVNRDHEGGAEAGAARKATRALGGLGFGGGGASSNGVLTRVWISLTPRGPGREARTTERNVYSLDGDPGEGDISERDRIRRGLALAGMSDMLLQTSVLRRSYVTARALDHELGNRAAMLGTLHYATSGDNKKMQASMEKLTILPQKLYDFAFTRLMLNPRQGEVIYTRPQLVAWHRKPRISEDGEISLALGMDLMRTSIDPVPGVDSPRKLRMEQGVVDSVLESAMLSENGTLKVGASDLLARIPAEEWVWLEDADDLDALPGEVDPGVREGMVRALERGESIFVPNRIADLGVEEAAWWEYSPETGEVIGRIAYGGWGGVISEYALKVFLAKASFLLAGLSIFMCYQDPGIACIVCAFIGAVFVLVIAFSPEKIAVPAIILNMQATLGCGLATSL